MRANKILNRKSSLENYYYRLYTVPYLGADELIKSSCIFESRGAVDTLESVIVGLEEEFGCSQHE